MENIEASEVNMSSRHTVTLAINPAVDKSTSIDRVMFEHRLWRRNPEFEPDGREINGSRAIKKTRQRLNEWTRESLAVFKSFFQPLS